MGGWGDAFAGTSGDMGGVMKLASWLMRFFSMGHGGVHAGQMTVGGLTSTGESLAPVILSEVGGGTKPRGWVVEQEWHARPRSS
jgi:hypothetical protein